MGCSVVKAVRYAMYVSCVHLLPDLVSSISITAPCEVNFNKVGPLPDRKDYEPAIADAHEYVQFFSGAAPGETALRQELQAVTLCDRLFADPTHHVDFWCRSGMRGEIMRARLPSMWATDS